MEFAAEQQQREYDQDIAYELGAVKAERDYLRRALAQIANICELPESRAPHITWLARLALRTAGQRASAQPEAGRKLGHSTEHCRA